MTGDEQTGSVGGGDRSLRNRNEVARLDAGPRAGGAVARLKLTRRVVRALEPITDAKLDADVENLPLP